MKDELIIFETAKLAKEKGFDWHILHSYRDGILDLDDNYAGTISEMYFNANGRNRTKFKEVISAPTQSLLQKWLREVHNIIVFVAPFKDHASDVNDRLEWNYTIYGKSIGRNLKSYEEALEIGLQEALKLIL